METYATDEERLEALQRWWKENKSSIFGGLLLGLAVIAGWKMWQSNKLETAEQASLVYHQLTEATQAKQTEAALKLGQRLIQQYPSTTYAEYARLFVAKLKVEAGDLDGARKILEEELSHSKDDALKTLTRLRLGRIMLAMGDVEPALKLLGSDTDQNLGKFAGLYAELQGDLLVAAKRPAEARTAFEKARELGNLSPLLELKINDLPASP
ncbi:MAG: tetratricopeptide repeat protein [Methylococcaceae bacterium]|jgi:predicted negative regulator of RcsB-dependent stress response|nr:tetratricopeptide repeat protein [Methylococcaceae bacterium]